MISSSVCGLDIKHLFKFNHHDCEPALWKWEKAICSRKVIMSNIMKLHLASTDWGRIAW